MSVPAGFRVTLFAGEPDVVQPIAMCTDARGRLWVVECLSYPTWQTEGEGHDRVSIFEDTDGDGQFDSKRVFWDKGRNLTGLALGLGGVWLCSAPELIFIPDRNGDDTPDSPPQVVLDGWTLEAKHNIVNGLAWGPDGWLYGCHGILADSKVGVPGTRERDRVVLNCSVWRFHPGSRQFEVVARGMTNPWSIAFNEYGQAFADNCVIKHLFHIIPGARFERMYGQDDNPYTFQLMASCADHIHWAGGFWKTEGAGGTQNDAAGGGHAHCGALIYLGESWPDEYRGTFFTLNVHGHRINNDLLERRGSGYVGRHRPDLLKANDPWFRGVSLVPAADGSVYMSDWSDAGECHDYEDIHRENGRIYKVSYGSARARSRDLAEMPDSNLIEFFSHKDDWHASQARTLLQTRAAAGKLDQGTRQALRRLLASDGGVVTRLRALWALHVTGGLDEATALETLRSSQEWLRAWTIQLALETGGASAPLMTKLSDLAAADSSAVVRLYLASALQKLSLPGREPLARKLLGRAEDAQDANIPLLLWYGIEPIVSTNDQAALDLLQSARVPMVRQFISQRLALRQALDGLARLLETAQDAALQTDVVRGMFEALNGRRAVPPPADWNRVCENSRVHLEKEVREKVLLLSLIFGDQEAAAALTQRAADPAAPGTARQTALQALVQARPPGLVNLLQKLLADQAMRGVALRGLAAFDDQATPGAILGVYAQLDRTEKADAINTLASRAHFAVALLKAVEQKAVPPADISPFAARQLQALKDPKVRELVRSALGEVRAVAQDKAAQIARLKKVLTMEALQKADRSHGRAVFAQACAPCHTLFGEGGKIGPELTGSQRSNLDYILENVVDPNAVVWNQYHATYFETRDDQTMTGLVLKENESTVTIQTQTGTVTLPRKDIVSRTDSKLSMMPEGLFDLLPSQDLLDLVAYLQSPSQVPK